MDGEQKLIVSIGLCIMGAIAIIATGCNQNSKLSNEIQKEYIAAGYTQEVLPGTSTAVWVKERGK